MPTALVTGAGVRVGRAIALKLARAGYDLVLHGFHSRAALTELEGALRAEGRRVAVVIADLAADEAPATIAAAVSAAGRGATPALDLLVNSAAAYERRPLAELTRAEWTRMLKINLEAPIFLTQALLPLLRAAGSASVVNVTDASVERPYGRHSHYLVSKAGLVMATRALAVELAPAVRVNAVAPGAVAFPESFDESKRERIIASVPLGKPGTPEDVAQAVLFLARDAPYITGQVLAVDGGLASH